MHHNTNEISVCGLAHELDTNIAVAWWAPQPHLWAQIENNEKIWTWQLWGPINNGNSPDSPLSCVL